MAVGIVMPVAIAVVVAVGGCTSAPGSSLAPVPGSSLALVPGSSLSPVPSPSGSPSASSGSSFPASVLEPIVGDAARRAGVAATEVEVISAVPRTWPDGSLGCPLPGMAYTQVLVDGYRVIVRAGSKTLDYRGSGPGRFRLCETPGPS